MVSTPLIKTVTNEVDALDAQTCPSGQPAGAGAPGSCDEPAEVESVNTHTSAHTDRIRLIGDSPVSEVAAGQAGFASRTAQVITQLDPDLVLFRSLADCNDFRSLTDLCRERQLQARDAASAVRWTKDRAIVEAMQGRFPAAYDLLASVHYLASQMHGTARGRYEDEFGIVLTEFNRSTLACDHFRVAYGSHFADGNLAGCARVDHNRARALMSRGEEAKAVRYLTRSLEYARGRNDLRLELEILESVKEFQLYDRIERKLT